jgi:hypothetical protein
MSINKIKLGKHLEKKIAMVSRKHFLQFVVSDKDDLQSLWDIVKELLLKKKSVDLVEA